MVKCLGSEAAVESVDEVFNELAHLRHVLRMIAQFLTDEDYLEQCGAGEAIGAVMDQGMMLALANERIERLIHTGRALASKGMARPAVVLPLAVSVGQRGEA